MSSAVDGSVDVLLVEDNPGDVRLTEVAVSEIGVDLELTVATDGEDALEQLSARYQAASSSVPDLVLLDLNLPRTGGFEFLTRLQDHPALARIPVLVLTSSNATEDILESYDLAANAYLTKPTDPDEYVEMLDIIVDFWVHRAALPPTSA